MKGKRVYVDFQPSIKWNKGGEEGDTIELHVPGNHLCGLFF